MDGETGWRRPNVEPSNKWIVRGVIVFVLLFLVMLLSSWSSFRLLTSFASICFESTKRERGIHWTALLMDDVDVVTNFDFLTSLSLSFSHLNVRIAEDT